jgi:hypothetical protein
MDLQGSHYNMKCMIGVLVIASLCLAEPEADPLHYYAPYSYPYFYRPYYASGYAGPLPGASYQSVHRLHKREADPQVAGPLTAAFGDLVATERGLRPISLEGFSEDVNQDGFVDPIAQAVPVAAPLVAAPAPFVRTVPAPFAPAFPAPFAVASPVVQAPVVKTVVETPATVTHVASPLVHHPLALTAPAASVVGLTSHDCVTPHGCAVRAALLAGTPSATFGHVTSTRIAKREAEPTAEASPDAEADADAYYTTYGYGLPYAGYSGYPYHPYNYAAYSPYTYGLGYSHYAGYNYYNNYLPYTAPVVKAAPAPLVAAPLKTVTKPVTYTHIGAHPVAPTTVLETETFF